MMRNFLAFQKLITAIIVFLLLGCSIQGIGYSQEIDLSEVEVIEQETKPMSAADIREKTLPSLVLILSGGFKGSGVLIERTDESSHSHKFILTNEHITRGNSTVEVYFTVYDLTGEVIQEPEFYENRVVLEELGYISIGRVIAEDKEADVAVIRLDSDPPKTAEVITYDLDEPEIGEAIHYLGNPADRELLWQWDAGHFRGTVGKSLSLDASAWHGNSGGPVVNKKGKLIGLIKTTDKITKTYAVSLEPISALMSKLERQQVFWIKNDTETIVHYEVKWSASDDWKRYTIDPGSKAVDHRMPSKYRTPWEKFDDFPKIRYISQTQLLHIDPAEGKTNQAPLSPTGPYYVQLTILQGDKTNEKNMPTMHKLKTKYQFFGKDVEDRIKPDLDGLSYHFVFDSQSSQIQLHEQRETVWIANHTDTRWPCEIEWAGDSPNTSYILEPGTARPHWNPISAKARQPYPQIRIKWKGGHDSDGTERLVEVKKKNLITKPEFFPILYAKGPERFSAVRDAEVKHTQTDSRKFIRGKHSSALVNYYYLEKSPENGILEIHHGYYISALSTEKVQRRGWKYWVTFVGLAIVGAIVLGITQIIFKRLKQKGVLLWFRKNDE